MIMKTNILTVLICLVFLLSPAIAFADHAVEIFNGKDLSGWTKRGGAGTYDVEDGEIVGRSAPNTINTFLCTDKKFGDFVLELDFKIDPTNFNSGVQIRSHSRPEGNHERVFGYQVEIDTKMDHTPDRPWTGGIYFEGGLKNKDGKVVMRGANGWLFDLTKNKAAQEQRHLGKWNHLKIVATGRRIQTWLNGVPAADFTDNDPKAFTPKGFIALQVHAVGKSTHTKEVRFKNLKLTVLD
jgi:3-keto-disaccharide hydrolase